MGKGNCKGGTCSSEKIINEKEHECGHGCGCHSHEHNHSEEHAEHECGCGHKHHGGHAEHGGHEHHGHAHVHMTPKEELTLLKQYLENLSTEKGLVEKRIEELKKETKE